MKISILLLVLFSTLGCSEQNPSPEASLDAETEDLPFIYNTANDLFEGDDPVSALKLLESVQNPNGHIHEFKATLYLQEPKTKNIKKGFISMTLAAEAGMPNSRLYLGLCLRSGDCGLPKNSWLSTYWLNMADYREGDKERVEEEVNADDISTRYQSELDAYKKLL